jgi:hypothetical protein
MTESTTSTTRDAVPVGIGVGIVILSLYLMTGFIVANWSIQEFFAHLTPATVGWMIVAGGTTIAIFAIPIIAYLRLRVATPLIVLILILVGWTGLGIGQGTPLTATFGLSYYAFLFSPIYILLYLVCGGIEYGIQN